MVVGFTHADDWEERSCCGARNHLLAPRGGSARWCPAKGSLVSYSELPDQADDPLQVLFAEAIVEGR
ncbi:MAG: hypothetical protein OEV76_10290, partial [Anaerolineae bacterium]|nr:hypothetical protein [Anaerolineae bacterium]